jgi:Recombination endonuclease VII
MTTKPELIPQAKYYCDACGEPPPSDFPKLYVHQHDDGRFRGWLCFRCFSMVEAANNDPVRLRKMADWVTKNR